MNYVNLFANVNDFTVNYLSKNAEYERVDPLFVISVILNEISFSGNSFEALIENKSYVDEMIRARVSDRIKLVKTWTDSQFTELLESLLTKHPDKFKYIRTLDIEMEDIQNVVMDSAYNKLIQTGKIYKTTNPIYWGDLFVPILDQIEEKDLDMGKRNLSYVQEILQDFATKYKQDYKKLLLLEEDPNAPLFPITAFENFLYGKLGKAPMPPDSRDKKTEEIKKIWEKLSEGRKSRYYEDELAQRKQFIKDLKIYLSIKE